MEPEANLEYALTHSSREFREPRGPDIIRRTEPYFHWQQARVSHKLWPYSRVLEKSPKQTTTIKADGFHIKDGINFASQDYLSLAGDESVKEAAIKAIKDYGLHSAGSAILVGNTELSISLEDVLGDYLKAQYVTLFPTGWAAGYGVSRGLVTPNDYILIDSSAHSCLQEGAYAATRKVSVFKHLDVEHARTLLGRIRKQDADNGILVLTECLFSMDSDTPDIGAFQSICNEFGATLVADLAHDLGAMGPGGTGILGIQGMLGKVDIVMGSYSKSFASNGGYIATNSAAVRQHLKAFSSTHTFSNAMSPAQAAVVLKAIEIIRSDRGDDLRAKLFNNSSVLRKELLSRGLNVMGSPSPIVPVLITEPGLPESERAARLAAGRLMELGVLANLAEFPGVPQGLARFRLQVMANHSPADAEQAAKLIALAIHEARGSMNVSL